MSTEKLNKFLKALDAVKEDYTCGVCLKFCKNPITLSSCFHIICSEHFDSLTICPSCNIPLLGCKIITDSRLESCVDSAKELYDIFEPIRKDNNLSKPGSSKAESATEVGKKRSKRNLNSVTPLSDKENKNSDKSNIKSSSLMKSALSKKHDKGTPLNSTFNSNVSSKTNKGIEKRNTKGETSLHIACRLGKVDKVVELLKQGANTNTKDNAGWTPLHEVVQNGRLDLVEILLQYNTLINVPGQSNETPLHEAVRYNHKEISEKLVKNGADLYAQNCKGETPLDLASEEIKQVLENAAEEIIQTQGVNVTHISELHTELDYEEIRIYSNSQFRTVHNKLKMLSKHHSNVHIEAKFTKKVTHLIVDDDSGICATSVDVLQGIVYGIWILSSQWVTKSNENDLEHFKDYEITGVGNKIYNGPKNSRFNKYKQLPGIFNGCHFYLHNFNTKYEITKTLVVTKAILTKLIIDAGGAVLRRVPNPESIPESEALVPYHAKKGGKLTKCSHYIIFQEIYEPMYNMAHIKALPIGWLIECLEKYELCEPW